ncbi:serine hydrolase domain-containing protein [Streptomyces indicus]|uniref:CubicO group peptidase, beta-lactamase class C family n=1 Tax=Streptomyces indicus TaxID=417292 RepID=A0A1G9JMW1_9ACTN|nr:serine hydrolase domain-containing protein [Streptomyces indicus]SDL38859.1 CubicO group peptidase, beta-lactamase class C family [Streptomyces indicus]
MSIHHRMRHAVALTLALLLALLLGAPLASAVAGPASTAHADLDAYIRERMDATGTPGLSYAVVGPDGPVHQRSWGHDGRGAPVTADTPFLWGSVAKPVTATAVMTLVQDGRLALDDRVVDHLPAFRFGGAEHASEVTVRHLLDQTAGIPAAATFKVTDCHDPDCPPPADRISALDDVTPLGPPGAEYAYTSANYLLLAAVVEAVTGRPYAEYLRTRVLRPAGMDGAVADGASARERRLAPGHQLMWGRPAAVADGYDEHGAAYGYTGGALHDLAAFAALQLRRGKAPDGARILTEESVRLMRTEGTLASGEGTGYGFGWRVGGLEAPLDKAVWHIGASPGYSAMLFLLPGQNQALVIQQNLHGLLQDEAIMEVGFGAARILAGGEAPSDAPSMWLYDLTIWGTTALAVLMLLAAARSVQLLIRRSALRTSRARRVMVTALWAVAGALPGVLLAMLVKFMGVEQAWSWFPDLCIALWVAAVAGVLVIGLRLAGAVRPARRRESPAVRENPAVVAAAPGSDVPAVQ